MRLSNGAGVINGVDRNLKTSKIDVVAFRTIFSVLLQWRIAVKVAATKAIKRLNVLNERQIMAKATTDQDFLEYLIKALVDHPEDVKVDRKVDEMGVLLTLKVHPEDMGQVVGREGSTAKSIRTLVRIVGMKNHARVNLKIEEPEGGRGPRVRDERASLEELKL